MHPICKPGCFGDPGCRGDRVAQEYQNVFASTERTDRGHTATRCGSPSTKAIGESPASTSTCGRRVRARVHQDLRLLPTRQGLDQRS